jgi:hypothetical protein
MTIDWKPFEPEVFERATQLDRPVLLLITVPWCSHCRELQQTTFADADVVDLVNSAFVAAHADAERRPDVNDRYGAAGWPTIAFLTPGGELICHENFLTAQQLAPRLAKVRDFVRDHRRELDQGLQGLWKQKQQSEQAHPRGELNQQIVEDVVNAIYTRFDHRHGGWGEGTKFPHPEAIDFALVQVARRNDPRMKIVVTVTLDRMMEGAIHDPIDGGFFRFSKTPDWRSPNFEKVLDANTQRLRCYLEAYQLFGTNGYRKAAEGIVRWLMDFMHDDATGAFFGSQDADADYYALDAAGRRARKPPRIDRTIYTNWNAMTVSALLKAAIVLDAPRLREVALRTLHFLRENLCERGGVVYHYWDGTYHLPGLLADRAYLIRALIDASQHTGDADLLLPAEAIAERAIREQRAPGGGFYDVLHDGSHRGSMARRNRSILENSVMAEALVRLSYLSRRSEFYDEGVRTLEAFTSGYKEYGYYVAGYGRATDLIFYEPLTVTIVGQRDSELSGALRRCALSTYVPSRIVQMLDPRYDPILLERSGYRVEDRPVAYLSVGKTTKAVVHDVEALQQQMTLIEEQRRSRASGE